MQQAATPITNGRIIKLEAQLKQEVQKLLALAEAAAKVKVKIKIKIKIKIAARVAECDAREKAEIDE